MGLEDLSTVHSSLKFPGWEECISSQADLKQQSILSFPLSALRLTKNPFAKIKGVACLDFKPFPPAGLQTVQELVQTIKMELMVNVS